LQPDKVAASSRQSGELPNSSPNSSPKEGGEKELSPPNPTEHPPQDSESSKTIGVAIKEACKINITKSNAGKVYKTIEFCKMSKIPPTLIKEFGKWFNTHHWPGKFPTPDQIINDWPKFEYFKINGLPAKGKSNGQQETGSQLTEAQQEQYRKIERERFAKETGT
jgi:hypothetical protein